MKIKNKIFICIIAILVTACGEKVPTCGDEIVTTTLNQIISKKANVLDDPEMNKFINSNLNFSFQNPVMTDENEKTKKRTCKIEVIFTTPKNHIAHAEEANNAKELAEKIILRWQLISNSLAVMDFVNLENIKNSQEVKNDIALSKLIEQRSSWFKKANGLPEDASLFFLALMSSPKNIAMFDKTKNDQLESFTKTLQDRDSNQGVIKFTTEYTVEKIEGKNNNAPYISATWNPKVTDGIVLALLWEKAYEMYFEQEKKLKTKAD